MTLEVFGFLSSVVGVYVFISAVVLLVLGEVRQPSIPFMKWLWYRGGFTDFCV